MDEKHGTPKNHQIIRNAYESTLTAGARLAAYASCIPTQDPSDLFDARQTLLVTDDLVHFALNARRLIENTKSFSQISPATIKVAGSHKVEEKPISRILNIIIHHSYIHVFRFNYDLINWSDPQNWPDLRSPNKKSFPPMISIKSDSGGDIMFQLQEFMTTFESKVLSAIVDACDDVGLYLNEI